MPSSSKARPPASSALRLEEVLRLLPPRELNAIVEGLGIRVDRGKRIGVPGQVARALVCLPEARDPTSLPEAARQLLHGIAEAGGVLLVDSLPAAVEPLVARGLVFARAAEADKAELLLPIAYMVQLQSWAGEDPRGVRALLAQASPSVAASIASHYLGSSATNPLSLALEPAWSVLTDPERLAREVASLAPSERKLLASVEEQGGEVDTEELLELEREPMRLRGATGATPSRRGVGFALERRGFLVPIHPNRHVVPSEVARLVGAGRLAAREEQRAEIRVLVEAEDHAPRRARFATDPAPLALAMSAYLRERQTEVRPNLGTPRSLLARLATRFGQEPASVALIAAASRAIGLWDASARNSSSAPGNLSLNELGQRLFEVWRKGGVWDEARPQGEVLRAAGSAREASVIGVVRSLVLDGLMHLGEDRWVPWEAIAGFVLTDARAPGLARLLERWAQRCGIAPAHSTLGVVAERVAFESLFVLGCVDVDDREGMTMEGDDDRALRITARGRAYLAGCAPPVRRTAAFRDHQVLSVGQEATVAQVLSLVPFVEVGRVEEQLEVVIAPSSIWSALASGLSAAAIRRRLEAIAALPEEVERTLSQASTVLARSQFVPTAGFLWIDDIEVRQLLATRRQTAELFLDPSPPGGLLLAPGVDLERVVLRCRSLGVEVLPPADDGASSAAPSARRAAPDSEGRRSATRRRGSGSRRRDGSAGSRGARTG